jgi:predicted amidohydrolase YtcJ
LRCSLSPLSLLLLFGFLSCAPRQHADIIFQNAVVWTGTGSDGVTCVAVTGDRIVYTGDDDGASRLRGPNTRVVDLHGRLLLPGLVDAHAHLHSLGRALGEVALEGTDSAADVAARVTDAQTGAVPGSWIHGRGWDQNDWAVTEFPTWRDLAGTEANPVYLGRVDGHALWLNRTAIDACGITRNTPDPDGGRIIRDADGEPTGVLIDNAENLVFDRVPEPAPEEVDTRLRRAIRECNRLGLVGFHDAGTTPEVLASLRRLGAAGDLTLSVYVMLDSDYPALLAESFDAGRSEEFGGRLVIRCVKLRADGALGSRGAALLAPYDDDPGNTGLIVQPESTLYALTAAAFEHGFQPATHAIGDRGNRLILDVYERAADAVKPVDARPRVEHCQILDVDDLTRFAPMGVIASMQPTHATSDMPWAARRVGEARLAGAYAWRSLLDSGAHLAFGSDAPVESVDPLWGIYAAVTRQDHAGNPPGGWRPGEKVTMDEALRAFTSGAAYAAFDESRAGMVAPGMRADLTIIDTNLLAGEPASILTARAVMTVVHGEIVYEASSQQP